MDKRDLNPVVLENGAYSKGHDVMGVRFRFSGWCEWQLVPLILTVEGRRKG